MYLGIDFGTSTNYIVKVDLEKEKIIPVKNIGEFGENDVLDNAIYYGENEELIGKSAIKRSESDPKNLVRYIKLKMGLENYETLIPRKGKRVSPVEIASDIFRKIKEKVEGVSGTELIDGVVITVPFDYMHKERKAIKEAAERGGLKVLGLIEEPLAASISTNLKRKDSGIEVIFDLGGGTLDITVSKVEVEGETVIIETLNTEGSKSIGGRHIDKVILDYIEEENNLEGLSSIEINRLLEEIKNEKENLSEDEEVEIFWAERDIEMELSEKLLEEILENNGLLEKIRGILYEAIDDVDIQKELIKRVIFVGGGTRLNIIKRVVEKFFGNDVDYVNYDEQKLVGEGAGYYLMDLIKNRDKYKIIPKLNHSIGIDKNGLIERIIEKNFNYNKESKIKEYTIEKLEGKSFLDVYQGESDLAKDCTRVGKIEIDGKEINGKLGISLIVDKNGIIKYNIYQIESEKLLVKEKELS